jgi:hypothetical protein
MPQKEYVEIVHQSAEELLEYTGYQPQKYAIAQRILSLPEPHYFLKGNFSDDLPNIPKDTPIRIGGDTWKWCVRLRAEALRKAGYTDVTEDRSISIAVADDMIDEGYKKLEDYGNIVKHGLEKYGFEAYGFKISPEDNNLIREKCREMVDMVRNTPGTKFIKLPESEPIASC